MDGGKIFTIAVYFILELALQKSHTTFKSIADSFVNGIVNGNITPFSCCAKFSAMLDVFLPSFISVYSSFLWLHHIKSVLKKNRL